MRFRLRLNSFLFLSAIVFLCPWPRMQVLEYIRLFCFPNRFFQEISYRAVRCAAGGNRSRIRAYVHPRDRTKCIAVKCVFTLGWHSIGSILHRTTSLLTTQNTQTGILVFLLIEIYFHPQWHKLFSAAPHSTNRVQTHHQTDNPFQRIICLYAI